MKINEKELLTVSLNEGIMQERVMVKPVTLEAFTEAVAAAFAKAPEIEEEAKPHYDALVRESEKWLTRISKKNEVDVVGDEDDYKSQKDLVDDVVRKHKIKVSTAYHGHPYLTDEQYRLVRVVHDFLTHAEADESFGPRGEMRAYNTHCKLFSDEARPALFTEIVGVNCCYAMIGHSPKPKCCILKGFDFSNVGRMAVSESSKRLQESKTMSDGKHEREKALLAESLSKGIMKEGDEFGVPKGKFPGDDLTGYVTKYSDGQAQLIVNFDRPDDAAKWEKEHGVFLYED